MSRIPLFSKLTLFFGLFIVISASFMRQMMNFTKSFLGESGFSILINILFIASGIFFLFFMIQRKVDKKRLFTAILIAATSLALISKIKIAEEKVHLLEFAILGWLAARDVFTIDKKYTGIVLAFAFTFLTGILDEGFQAILPYRYFQGWDILLNSLGGAWGIVLFLVLNKR